MRHVSRRPAHSAQDLTKDKYMSGKNDPTINHFYEKLLKLKGMMKTASGRKLAEHRYGRRCARVLLTVCGQARIHGGVPG